MNQVFDDVIATIGNTPIVRLHKCVPQGAHKFFGKLEYFNPGNSVKDRLGLALINDAEKRGELKPGGTIVEATSGNTGMGLAMVAAVRGYKSVFVMPDKISEEKRAILRAYGAQVVITPTGVEPDDPRSHYSVAKKIAETTPNSFYANQYHNPANAQVHYRTTGPEIWEQMAGKIDVLVAGIGTGGTLSGIGRFLKEKNPKIKIVCADPVGSILYDLFYYKEVRTPPASYKVEGVGEDMLPQNVHFDVIDDFVQFNDPEAFSKTRELTASEGICVGPSSGGALVAAMKYAQKLKEPANILVIFPDNGRAYMSKTYNMRWLSQNGIMELPLSGKTTGDFSSRAMASDVPQVDANKSAREVLGQMRQRQCQHVLIMEAGSVAGVVSLDSILERLASGAVQLETTAKQLMRPIAHVSAREPLANLQKAFEQNSYVFETDGKKVLSRADFEQFLTDLK